MTKQAQKARYHRYQLVHGDDGDFIAYQRDLGNGVWQTYSTWLVPRANYN